MDPERASPEEIRHIQHKNVAAALGRAFENSPFYRRHFQAHGFLPGDFRSMDDISRLPFTGRSVLSGHDAACAPRSLWVDICPTSGTTGRSIYFPMTAADLDLFAALSARGGRGLGIDEGDTVQVMITSDNLMQPSRVMTQAFQYHLGCLTLRAGPVGHARQVEIMRELKPTVLFGIPSYLLSLGRSLGDYGFDPRKELDLKLLISTGDTIYHGRWEPTAQNREISRLWGAPYYSILGSTELNAGLWECPARNGHHVHWDYYIPEIVDPGTGESLPPGQKGELTLTLTGREAMPLFRYRTGDVTAIEDSPCPCGRTSPRIMAISGRTDQMLKVKGTAVFPIQVEEAVLSVEGVSAHRVEVSLDGDGREVLSVFIDSQKEEVLALAARRVKDAVNITPRILWESREIIEKSWHADGGQKPRKFIDHRKPRSVAHEI
jgi:phenylacetate-CoA ligase